MVTTFTGDVPRNGEDSQYFCIRKTVCDHLKVAQYDLKV
jgi:hypothetical protein